MALSATQERRRAIALAQERTLGLARLAAADHENLIAQTRQLLGLLSDIPDVTSSDPAKCGGFLADVEKTAAPRYLGFGVVDRDGTVLCSSNNGRPMRNVSDRLYFREVKRTRRFAVGEYNVSPTTGEAFLGMAAPILDEAGEVEGVGRGRDPVRPRRPGVRRPPLRRPWSLRRVRLREREGLASDPRGH